MFCKKKIVTWIKTLKANQTLWLFLINPNFFHKFLKKGFNLFNLLSSFVININFTRYENQFEHIKRLLHAAGHTIDLLSLLIQSIQINIDYLLHLSNYILLTRLFYAFFIQLLFVVLNLLF